MAAKIVCKFRLSKCGIDHIPMPRGAVLLHVDFDHEGLTTPEIHIWAACDMDAELEVRKFETIGTGDEIPENGFYVGTAKAVLVWHIFELDPAVSIQATGPQLPDQTITLSKDTFDRMVAKVAPVDYVPTNVVYNINGTVTFKISGKLYVAMQTVSTMFNAEMEQVVRKLLSAPIN